MLINILNENKKIPIINKEGPIFGMEVLTDIYFYLRKHSDLIIETTTADDARRKRDAYLARKESEKQQPVEEKVILLEEPEIITNEDPSSDENEDVVENVSMPVISESIPVSDSLDITRKEVIFETVVEKDEVDSAIDDILEDSDYVISYNGDFGEQKIKRYRKNTLLGMKKKDLSQILIDRGYAAGKYSPKYYDTAEKLIEKILKTQ